MEPMEIAKEIVLAMIEKGQIKQPDSKASGDEWYSDVNAKYANEINKVYKSIHENLYNIALGK